MPKSVVVGSSTRRVSDLKMPLTLSGKQDRRFKDPQMCKNNGTKDGRTKLTASRR